MNLILLHPSQFINDQTAVLTHEQAVHVHRILKSEVGDLLKVGQLNGAMGSARIQILEPEVVVAIESLDQPPPATLPLILILALPRPQMIKRILQTIACMGVEELHLLQTARVEKSFWQSPSVTDAAIEKELCLGLEQGMATQLPRIVKHPRFRPFAEDQLPTLAAGKQAYIAHPDVDNTQCPSLPDDQQALLAIGPEGGFIDTEVAWFQAAGFQPFSLGPRILKVETAVTALLAKLY